MNNSYLKFCKYYHGEESNPFPDTERTSRHFWMMELQFTNNIFGKPAYNVFLSLFEKVKDEDKIMRPLYKNENLPLEVRVFLTYCVASYLHTCGDIDYKFLLDYGKK